MNKFTYEEAKVYLKHKFPYVKTIALYDKEKFKFSSRMLKAPQQYYGVRNTWVDWFDFLNKEKPEYCSYEEAKNWALENIEAETFNEWRLIVDTLPNFIPRCPDLFFEEEFEGWQTFLGRERKIRKRKHFLSYLEAKKYMKKHFPNIKTAPEFRTIKEQLPETIPRNPGRFYEGFSWQDFLDREKRKRYRFKP